MRLITGKEFQRSTAWEIDHARGRRVPILIQVKDGQMLVLLPIRPFFSVAAYDLAIRKGSPLLWDVSEQQLALVNLVARKYGRKLAEFLSTHGSPHRSRAVASAEHR